MSRFSLFVKNLMPVTVKGQRIHTFFQVLSFVSLIIGICLVLTFYHSLKKMNVGMTSAIRGVVPQVMVYKTSMLKSLETRDLDLIRSRIADSVGHAVAVNEVYLKNVHISLVNPQDTEGKRYSFRTMYRVIDTGHLAQKGFTGLIPARVMKVLLDDPDSVALTRDLLDNFKTYGLVDPKNDRYLISAGAAGETRRVKIAHVFDMMEGRLSNFIVGSHSFLAHCLGRRPASNLVGIEFEDIHTLSDLRNQADLLRSVLNPNAPKTNVERLRQQKDGTYTPPYIVSLWVDILTSEWQNIIQWLNRTGMIVALVLAVPSLVQVFFGFRFFIEGRNKSINLFRIFGFKSTYVYSILFFWGLGISGLACLIGFVGYRLITAVTDRWIGQLMLEGLNVNISNIDVPLGPQLFLLSLICIICGVMSYFRAWKIYKQAPSDLLIK